MRVLIRTLAALAGAALLGGMAVAAAGLEPLPTLQAVIEGAVGDRYGIRSSLIQAVPITLTAVGVTLALRASLFNLGGEGQIYMGALGATIVALAGQDLPGWLLLLMAIAAAVVAGFGWGLIAGLLRATLGLSEIITTIMLNFIAFFSVSYLLRGPIQDPQAAGYPYSEEVPSTARLAAIGELVPVGAILTVVIAAGCWLALDRSRPGMRINDLGQGEPAARFAGIPIGAYTVAVLGIAGALSGLAGGAELLGNQLRLSDRFSPGWGFDAVAVALIGRGNPFGTLAAGLFFGALRSGIDVAQASAAVPAATAQIIQAATVLLLVAANSDVVAHAFRSIRRASWRPRAGTA